MTWRPHRLQDAGVNVDTWFSPDFIHKMDMEGKPHLASYLNGQLISDDDSQDVREGSCTWRSDSLTFQGTASNSTGNSTNSTGNSTAESSEGDDVEGDGVLLPTGGMAFEEDYVGRPPKAQYKRRVRFMCFSL